MFYGLDVHKEFIQVCRLWPDGKRRQDFQIPATAEAIEAFACTLTRKDQVALEVTFHTWAICQLLVPHAGRVVAVDATQVKAIASARIKTDKVDAHTLAQLLRADFLPAVRMPSAETWALRQLISQRRLLLKQQTATKNTIHAILQRRLIPLPAGWTPFALKTRRWMRELALLPAERFMLDNALDLLEQIEIRVAGVDEQLLRHAKISESAKLLMTIPGIDVIVAIGLLARRHRSWLPTSASSRASGSRPTAASTAASPRPAAAPVAPSPSRPPRSWRGAPHPWRPPTTAFATSAATT
jgi:transposase